MSKYVEALARLGLAGGDDPIVEALDACPSTIPACVKEAWAELEAENARLRADLERSLRYQQADMSAMAAHLRRAAAEFVGDRGASGYEVTWRGRAHGPYPTREAALDAAVLLIRRSEDDVRQARPPCACRTCQGAAVAQALGRLNHDEEA